MNEDKNTALVLLRVAAAAGKATADMSPDPLVSGIATGASGLIALVAKLVESVGVSKAEEVLQGLVGNPAKPITIADLDADVERVRRELGL